MYRQGTFVSYKIIMKFLKNDHNTHEYVDSIFTVVNAAKADKDPSTVNATAGCLYGEDGKLLIYNTVVENEAKIDPRKKASYASSPKGNPDYVDAITKYVLEDRVTNNHATIATTGGTGALFTSLRLCIDEGTTFVSPDISWDNYRIMTQEFRLKALKYDVYDLNDLFAKIDECTGKAIIIINSPCENPLGHSYTQEEWKKIFEKLNNLNREAILIIDCAYMDYAYNDPKKYFENFNHINDNVLVLLAYSCSKSFSYYGYRLGALIAINNDAEFVRKFQNLASRVARSVWTSVSNLAMTNLAGVLTEHFDEYVKERNEAVQSLKKRTDLFISQAKECGLEIYPYTEGFFVTVKTDVDEETRNVIHKRLMDNHIYTIAVTRGLRVGLCSTPLAKVDGLAKRIKDLI